MTARKPADAIRSVIKHLRYRRIYRKFKDFTMIPETVYIDNLRLANRAASIDGCVVECGTWRGGMSAGMADVLGAGRRYYLFDSFEGLPPATEMDGGAALAYQLNVDGLHYHNNCAASEEDARRAMSLSAASEYHLIKGWFSETLPKADLPEPIAILRMDADWYESYICILENFVSRVAPGGMIIVDDYHTWEGCTKAVNEFAAERKWRIRQTGYGEVCFIVV